jgi:hypothetical protein
MRMVCTGYLHIALGIEFAGVGGYKGMTVMYFFWNRISTVSDLSIKSHSRLLTYCVLCGAFKKVSQASRRPNGFIRMPGRPITANGEGLLY